MTTETQNPQSQADQVSEHTGSEEEAAAAFAAKDGVPQEQESEEHDEADPDDEPKDDEGEEPGDGETEPEDDPKEKLVEVEFEGKTYEVPEELQKGLMRQSDYSRKMNEVGEKEKAYTQRMEQAEKLVEGAEKFADALAEVKGIDTQLKQFEKVDWQGLRATNPAEYAALAADMQSLRLARDQATRKAQGFDAEIVKVRGETLQAKQDEMQKALKKGLKGWGDELGQKITSYALKSGYTADELRSIADAKIVIALDKARKYDALQAEKSTLKAKAQDAPRVTKPGSPRKPDVKSDAMTRLRKENSLDAAAAAFLAM